MSQTQNEIQTNNTNEIQIKKKVFLFIHNDGINEKSLEPIILVDGEKLYTVMIKRKYPYDMYYFFENKKYLKLWNDKKGNILVFISNWSGDLFINQKQSVEYIDGFNYIAGESELTCETREGQRKKIVLEGFDILTLAINQFTSHEEAIFYILCTKLS